MSADRVELAFRRAALRLIPDGARVLAAVSGGPDSVALLHLLAGQRRGLEVSVAHLDHGLRRGSATDRRFVERLASRLSMRCVAERRPVAELRRRDESPEEAARRVRRAFLVRTAKKLRADLVATGHTLDDQAETVLMRMVRGGGPSALSGMAETGPGPFVRPLLGIERADLRGYLERRGLDYRDDPSNRDLRFDRNRTRRLVLPVVTESLNPRAARHIVAAAERLRADACYLDELAAERYRGMKRRLPRNRLRLSAGALAGTPRPLALRIARLALIDAGADPRRIAARHLEAIHDLASGTEPRRVDLPGKIAARRRRDAVVFETRTGE